jgi:hypothetical protein
MADEGTDQGADPGADAQRDALALAMMQAWSDPWAQVPTSENVTTGDPLPLTGFERFGDQGWPYSGEGMVPADPSQLVGLGGEMGNQNIANETLDNIYLNNIYDPVLNPDPYPYQPPDPNNLMSDFDPYRNITPTVPPGEAEATVVPGPADAQWDAVPAPTQGFFEGTPYDGSYGIPGSYGAPGGYGSNRRANL